MSRPARFVAVVAAAGSTLLWLLGVPPASACSPPTPPPGFGAFLEHTPGADATGVPTNPAVILYVERLGRIDGFTVAVTEEMTGRVVAGSFGDYFRSREFVAWRPSAPLRPLTRYRVDAAVVSAGARPVGATGAPQVSFGFMTADKPLPAITAQGQMQVRIERYQREDGTRCTTTPVCGGCGGCYCASTAARELATIARIKLPAFFGGLSTPGYYALVRVTPEVPYQFPEGEDNTAKGVVGTGSISDIQEGAETEVLAQLDYMAPYSRPCFALRVADLAGNVLVGDSVCLDVTVEGVQKLPLPKGTSVQPIPQTPSPNPPPPAPGPEPTSGGGCAVAAVSGHPTLPLWAIGLALLFLKRARTRARPAPTHHRHETLPSLARSQFLPSNVDGCSAARSTSSRQRTFTSILSGSDRGT